MNKKNIVVVVIVVVLVVGIGFWLNKQSVKNAYSVVQMTTGEVYVGELKTFPELELKNAYILQLVKDEKDPTKNNFQLNPVNQALWAPSSLHFVRENIVFYGQLAPNSKIAETIAAQK